MAKESDRPSPAETTRTAARPRAVEAEPTRLRLIVVTPKGVGTRDLPAGGRLIVGRAESADVRIDDGSISRQHAELWLDGPYRVRDLESHNGVRVAGRVVEGEAIVRPGEVIELGDVTIMLQHTALSAQAGAARLLSTDAGEPSGPPPAAGRIHGPWLERTWPVLSRIARGHISVLLLGETGVGKEVFASLVHEASPRRQVPLVALNCTALPESLLESEIFGHEKGAFTGATAAKPGLLEAADGGTLFLDEIGDMPLNLQGKLLRVIEDGRFHRLGSVKPRVVDVRYVAATNRDLEAEVAAGRFRRDLFYRLNAFTLNIPPLRERRAELPALARAFLHAGALDGARPELSPAALALLERHAWPGNIRELKNAMERAALLCGEGPVRPEHLPPELGEPPASGSFEVPPELDLDDAQLAERRRIIEALQQCGGNQTRAAKELGISRRTLVSRLKDYAIPRPHDDG